MKKLIEKASSIWEAYSSKIIVVLCVIAFLMGLVFVGQWYSGIKADEFVKKIHEKFKSDNKSLYQSIADLKAKTKILEEKYNSQLKIIDDIKKAQRKEIKDVFKTGNTEAIASFFDNVVDDYNPGD